jgi:hypothetical protein
MTTSLHALISDIRGLGWAGFSTRYWMISDHDPCVAYLARAAWDASATPDSVYRDQARSVCGPAAVEPMVRALHELERTTVGLEFDALGLTFPVPGMIMSQWAPGPTPQPVESARQGYQRALEAAGEARGVCAASGRAYVDYWIGRLAFGVGYMNTIAAVRAAATAEKAGDRAGALRNAQEALGMATAAIEAFAGVARNQSDRAMVAVVDEYVWRPLKAKVSELGGTEGR